MFPLVHYFVNRKIYNFVPPLMRLGALWPDLAAAAGWERDAAHAMGRDFYAWCRQREPNCLDLALGAASHGLEPRGVDYFADEHWPGYRKGWCFMKGEPYMELVGQTTRLPEDMLWWKAHNFVEMGCELLTEAADPSLKLELLAAVNDQAAREEAARVLSAYCGAAPERIAAVFANAPRTFAIASITPLELAHKQCRAFAHRHQHHDGDPVAMAALLEQIRDDLTGDYPGFMTLLAEETGRALRELSA